MSPVLILPPLSGTRIPAATFGPPVPAATTLGKELRQSLPPSLVDALDKLGTQIQTEILDPLTTTSVDQLARTFERVFPKFRDYYISTVLMLWGFLQEDPQRLSALTIRSFQESERLIREHGPRWIGQDPSMNALQGLATITRIAKAATRLFDQTRLEPLPAESQAESWANALIAYILAISSVLSSLIALANERVASGRLENISALACWSKEYAASAFHHSKVMGLLRGPSPDGAIGGSDEEDLALADAGLDSYADMLRQDDRG